MNRVRLRICKIGEEAAAHHGWAPRISQSSWAVSSKVGEMVRMCGYGSVYAVILVGSHQLRSSGVGRGTGHVGQGQLAAAEAWAGQQAALGVLIGHRPGLQVLQREVDAVSGER